MAMRRVGLKPAVVAGRSRDERHPDELALVGRWNGARTQRPEDNTVNPRQSESACTAGRGRAALHLQSTTIQELGGGAFGKQL